MNDKGKGSSSSAQLNEADRLYAIDTEKLNLLKNNKDFLRDPKYFKSVRIGPSASMKMMMHVQSGVEKGIKTSVTGKPTEVMGFLVGHQDTEHPDTLIITDACALPIEGFETSVVSDTEEALNYQINLGEINARTKHDHDKFCGWYHSHPFDVDETSHCYLSNTDVTTQLAWQRSVEKDGDPWVAIVIDPLRSAAKGTLELESFRVYPPEYNAPVNECPDNRVITDDRIRVGLWGVCWNRYYKLRSSFYMSALSSAVLGSLKNNFLWEQALTKSPWLESDNVNARVDTTNRLSSNIYGSIGATGGSVVYSHSDSRVGSESSSHTNTKKSSRVASQACALANDCCQGLCQQMVKLAVFGNPNTLRFRKAKYCEETKNSTNGMDI